MLHTLILQYHQDLNHPTPSLCRLLIKVVERYIGIPLFEKIEDAKRSREPPYTKTKLLSVVCEGWWWRYDGIDCGWWPRYDMNTQSNFIVGMSTVRETENY